jgi:hypothetical protein
MSDTLQTILTRAEQQHAELHGDVEFLQTLLQQSAAELSVARLTVWTQTSQSSRMIAQTGDSPLSSPSAHDLNSLIHGDVRILQRDQEAPSTSGRHLLAAAVVAGDVRLVLDVVESQQNVDSDVLIQLADVFADLQRRRMLESHLLSSQQESAWQAVIAQVHASLDSSVIANTIATDVAAIFPCQRIAVGRRRGKHWDVIATTGVSQPNERSDAARQLSQSIKAAATGDSNAANNQTSTVRPLCVSRAWGKADWAVVLETEKSLKDEPQLERFLIHASLALSNSDAAQRNSPTNVLRRGIRSLRRPGTLVTVGLLAALSAILLLAQSDLRIEVYGEVVPNERTFVFAPDDGIITQLHVEEESDVSNADVLCVLTNEDLNVQLETIDGELAAANARLAAIAALRGARNIEIGEARVLSAERAELEAQTQSLARQSAMVTERLEHLQVTSRLTGRVYGDRLQQMLFQRPVQRGQYLFEVANPAADWQLQLRVPEADIRYVLAATEDGNTQPAISYSLETSPEVTRHTTLTSLGAATDVDRRGELSTLAIADLKDAAFGEERPGAGVVARIHCGRRSVGFVWFRQVIEFVQRHTWL